MKDFLLLLASPTALFTTLAYFSTYILVVWFSVWLPIYLVEAVKMTPGQMGTSVAIIGVVSVCIYMGVSMAVRSFIQEESELAIIKGIRRCGRHDSWCIVLFLNHDISKSNLGDSRHVFSKGSYIRHFTNWTNDHDQ